MIADQFAKSANCSDLITRLEQAEAGSRELDHDIAHALFSIVTPAMRVHHGDGWIHPEYGKVRCEPYTSSLDAITALIGEKLPGWNVTIRIPSDPKHRHVCEIGAPDDPDASITDPWPFRTSAGGSNAPLACAAALLRAIKDGEHG